MSNASNHDIPTLDAAGLRRFGFTTAALFVGIFALALPWLRDRVMPQWPFVVAAVFALPALVYPLALRPLYAAWMRVGLVLGAINSRIILGVFFVVLVVPVALWFKVFGRDSMMRRFQKDVATYRVPSRQREPKSMEAPF
jgi:hypothetical protein